MNNILTNDEKKLLPLKYEKGQLKKPGKNKTTLYTYLVKMNYYINTANMIA